MAKIDKVISIKVEGVRRIKELEDSLKKLRKEQRDNKKQSEGDANRYSKTAKAIKEQSTELRGLRKQMAGVNDTTKKGNKLQDSMFKGVVKGAAAFSILVTAFRRVNQALTSMISTFTEFEFIMAKVRAVSGATNDEFEQLSKSAAELGRTTFFTASQVAELQLNFSKLGFTTQEILDAQEATINLSVATGSDLARAATVAGSAIRGFGLDATETTRVVDVMAVAFTSSALDIEKFQTSMTKVAPIAAAAGFSIEETTAIMSKLSDTGIEASIAGTSLRNIFLKLQDPTSKLARRFGNTVPNLEELLKGLRDMAEAGDDFQDVLGLVDVRQVAAFQTMVNGAEDVATLARELENSAGAGQNMADVVGDTTQGAILKVKSAIEGFSIALVSNFGESMKKTLVRFAEFLNSLVATEEKTQALIKRIRGVIKILAAYVIGSKAATIATKIFTKGLFSASGASGALTGALAIARKGLDAFKVGLAKTGIGLAVIALGELAASFMFTNEEVEKAVSLQNQINSAMEDESKEILKLQVGLGSIVKTRREIAKIEGEGEVQKRRISRLRKQEEIDISNINKALKAENEELIDIKDTTENITKATDDLIKTLKNKALAGVYTKLYENIIEDFVAADIVKFAVDEVYGFQGDMETVIADLRSDFVAADASAPSDVRRQEAKERAQQLLDEQDLTIDEFERLVEEGALDKRLEELKTAVSDRLGGVDILNQLLSQTGGKVKKDGPDTKPSIEPLQNFLNEEMELVEFYRENNLINEREYNAEMAQARIKAFEDFLAQDLLDGDERLRVQKQLAQERIKLRKETAKLEILAEEDGKREALSAIGINTSEAEQRFIELEAEKQFLDEKLKIHKKYGLEVGDIEAGIRQNQIDTHEAVRQTYLEEIGSISEIGAGLQELVGENEKYNAIRQIGVKITQAAALAESLLNLQKQISNYESQKSAMLNIQEMVTQEGANAVTLKGIIASLGLAGAKAAEGTATQSKLTFPFNILAMASTIAAIIGVMASIKGLFGIDPKLGASAAGGSGGSSGGSSGGGLGSGSTLYSFAGAGSTFANGGMVYGNSHTNGGEKFAVGGRVVELEGGEAVINKRSTSMFRSQLSAMNAAGGGTKFADGGIANSPSFAQTQFDVMGQSMMSSGGRVTVVEADITSTQNSVKTIESEASF